MSFVGKIKKQYKLHSTTELIRMHRTIIRDESTDNGAVLTD